MSFHPRPAIQLVRRFGLVTLFCLLLVAIPAGVLLHRYSQSTLERIAEEQGAGYASLVLHAIEPQARSWLARSAGRATQEFAGAPEVAELRQRLLALSGTPILDVRIYDAGHRVLFSTDSARIGEVRGDDPGIARALTGQASSTSIRRVVAGTPATPERPRGVITAYVPIAPGSSGAGVLSIDADLSPFLDHMDRLRDGVAVAVGAAVSLLYLLLSLLIWRAWRIIHRQQRSLSDANQTLEARVEARTAELSAANDRLREQFAERERAETQQQLAATVFENTGDGILIVDAAQTIVAVNRAFCEITGYSVEEAIGKTPRMLNSGRQNEAFYLAFWDALSERGRWSGEIWNRRKNGEVFRNGLRCPPCAMNRVNAPTTWPFFRTSATSRIPRNASITWPVTTSCPACPIA